MNYNRAEAPPGKEEIWNVVDWAVYIQTELSDYAR
jgi:hypothetical protein